MGLVQAHTPLVQLVRGRGIALEHEVHLECVARVHVHFVVLVVAPQVNAAASVTEGHGLATAANVKGHEVLALRVHLIVLQRGQVTLRVTQLKLSRLTHDDQRRREFWVKFQEQCAWREIERPQNAHHAEIKHFDVRVQVALAHATAEAARHE